MKYEQIRNALINWPKYDGCQYVKRAPLLTEGFPGTFNLSYTEHHWLDSLGGYVNWDRDLPVSTVQTCVRLNDLDNIVGPEGWSYLGVFEMADLSGEIALHKRPDYGEVLTWQMAELLRFFNSMGIDSDRVHVSICEGGKVADLTSGAYTFDFDVPMDEVSRNALLDAGLPEKNIIYDKTRDTLLSLHVHRATPWGYRNEIYVEFESNGHRRLLDVATSEYLMWNPVFDGDSDNRNNIVGLEPIENGYFGISFGVERFCTAVNELDRVHDVDWLRSFYMALSETLKRELRPADYVLGESIRVLHRIYADVNFHSEARVNIAEDGTRGMSKKRRQKAAALKRSIPLSVTSADIERLLQVHAESQPWHQELSDAVTPTLERINHYRCTQKPSRIAAS